MGGVNIQFPANQYEFIYQKLLKKNIRPEGPFYKRHFFLRCLCLSVAESEKLLTLMKPQLMEAEAFAEVENQQFNDQLADMKKAHVLAKPRPTAKNKIKG